MKYKFFLILSKFIIFIKYNNKMSTKTYQLTEKNLDTCLYFYEQTKNQILNFYSFLKEYKENTKNYHSNLQQLFNLHLKSNNFDENSNQNNKNNIEKQEKNSIFELDSTTIENQEMITPLRTYLEKIIKFFREQIFSFELLIDSLDSPLILLKSNLDDTTNKISEIQKSIDNDKNIYINNYNLFENTNKDLLEKFENIEKEIVDDVIQTKKRPKEKEELEKNLDSKIKEFSKFQNNCLEQLNKNQSVAIDLNTNLNNYFKNINKCIIILLETLKNSFVNFIVFFNKSQSVISNEINSQKEILDNKNYAENEINNLINGNLKEISQEECNLKIKEYDIKILSDKNYFNNKITNNNANRKPRKSFKEIFFHNRLNNNIDSDNNKINKDENNYELTKEDIYNIVKKMYNFSAVNTSNYSLETELNKTQIIKITDKILNSIDKNEEIDEKEIIILNDLMKEKKYHYGFLIHLNNFRGKGLFELSKKNFDIISNIFLIIINNISHEPNENLHYDLDNAQLILALSLTFYYIKDSDKIYLRSVFKNNNNIFKSTGFWKIFIHYNIDNNIKEFNQDNSSVDNKILNKKIQNILFSNLVPTISSMSDFELKREDINNIVLSVLEGYGIEKEIKDNIINMIKSVNFQG